MLVAATDAVCPALVTANVARDVVIHLRVGDVLCVKPKSPNARTPASSISPAGQNFTLPPQLHVQRQPPPVAEVARVVKELAGAAPVKIMFGFHFRVCEAESYAYLNAVAEATGAEMLPESHPDVHFCYAAWAALFIQGKGGYSHLIRVVRDARRWPTASLAQFADFGEGLFVAKHDKSGHTGYE